MDINPVGMVCKLFSRVMPTAFFLLQTYRGFPPTATVETCLRH